MNFSLTHTQPFSQQPIYKEVFGLNPLGIWLAFVDSASPARVCRHALLCRWSPVVGWWDRAGICILQQPPKGHFVSPLSEGVGTVGTDGTDCLQRSPATGRMSQGFDILNLLVRNV